MNVHNHGPAEGRGLWCGEYVHPVHGLRGHCMDSPPAEVLSRVTIGGRPVTANPSRPGYYRLEVFTPDLDVNAPPPPPPPVDPMDVTGLPGGGLGGVPRRAGRPEPGGLGHGGV